MIEAKCNEKIQGDATCVVPFSVGRWITTVILRFACRLVVSLGNFPLGRQRCVAGSTDAIIPHLNVRMSARVRRPEAILVIVRIEVLVCLGLKQRVLKESLRDGRWTI